jgi:hypothetical protein
MPGATPVFGFPYPDPSDLVANYPALGQQLAEDVEDEIIAAGGGLAHISTSTFTAQASVSFDNVFTSTYQNYRLVLNILGVSGTNLRFRMRASGTDDTGTNYASQYVYGSNTSITGARETGQTAAWFISASTGYEVIAAYDIGSPQLAKQTSLVGSQVFASATVEVITWAANHDQPTAYDGITLLIPGGSFTGTARIYGYKNS